MDKLSIVRMDVHVTVRRAAVGVEFIPPYQSVYNHDVAALVKVFRLVFASVLFVGLFT